MNRRTLKALEGSIEKWRKIVAREGVDKGVANCPLCRELFLPVAPCHGCPVEESTGVTGCEKSPYEAWDRHQALYHHNPLIAQNECPTCMRFAKKELAFLESLLPEAS